MGEERIRQARTEALFRNVNERIAESAESFDAESTRFVCECADPSCTHRIDVTLPEYEEVRADGATFVLAPGHEDPAIERVVRRRGRFHVVEKIHRTVRETVLRLDPRTESA